MPNKLGMHQRPYTNHFHKHGSTTGRSPPGNSARDTRYPDPLQPDPGFPNLLRNILSGSGRNPNAPRIAGARRRQRHPSSRCDRRTDALHDRNGIFLGGDSRHDEPVRSSTRRWAASTPLQTHRPAMRVGAHCEVGTHDPL